MNLITLRDQYVSQRELDRQVGLISPTTFFQLNRTTMEFVLKVGSQREIDALIPSDFAHFVQHLHERGLNAKSRKKVQAVIKAMFRWGADNGLCSLPLFGTAFRAPATNANATRIESSRSGRGTGVDHSSRILSGKEIDTILEGQSLRFQVAVLLGINCGLGPADVGRMRWHNIDMKTGEFTYPRHKTGAMRRGYLWKMTRELLAQLPSDQISGYVLLTKTGQPYYRDFPVIVNTLSTLFSRRVKDLGLTGVTFYRLRHTFKTLGKRARDKDALNLAMGHRANTVEQMYDHEEIPFRRIKRVAMKVKGRLWPRPKLKLAQEVA